MVPSHYPNQCWPKSMSPITIRPQRVNTSSQGGQCVCVCVFAKSIQLIWRSDRTPYLKSMGTCSSNKLQRLCHMIGCQFRSLSNSHQGAWYIAHKQLWYFATSEINIRITLSWAHRVCHSCSCRHVHYCLHTTHTVSSLLFKRYQ